MRGLRPVAIAICAVALLVAACGDAVGPSSNVPSANPGTSAASSASPPPDLFASPSPRPTDPADSTVSPPATAPPPEKPAATRTPKPTAAPSPGADTPTPDTFWSQVERGIRGAARVEVEIAGPNAGTLRFEPDASATVIEEVVGYVCLDGRAYDGQSGFTRVPGRWTCGAPALVAGFRGIGQPIDAWNASIPTDAGRRESLTVSGPTWTWRYRAMSPFYGGAVRVSVTMDRPARRITAARRVDPTGVTRYSFTYGADFPPIAVPR